MFEPIVSLAPARIMLGEKTPREFQVRSLQDTFLIIFQPKEVVGDALLGHRACRLLLALHRVGSDDAALSTGTG